MVIDIQNCQNSARTSCQHFQTWRYDNKFCEFLTVKNAVWSGIVGSVHPEFRCPLQPVSSMQIRQKSTSRVPTALFRCRHKSPLVLILLTRPTRRSHVHLDTEATLFQISYTVTNGSVNIDMFEHAPIPVEKSYWRVHGEFFEKSSLVYCYNMATRFYRVRRNGKAPFHPPVEAF